MPPPPQWPSGAVASRLHAELVRGTATSSEEFAVAFFAPLCEFLALAFPHVSEDVRFNAAVEAVMSLIQRPEQYDPKQLALEAYLRMSARGDLRNLLTKEARHRKEVSLEFVAEPVAGGNGRAESDADAPALDDPRIVGEVASFDSHERITYELLRAGERHTDAFARALGLDERRPDLAAVVKRIKDNVKVRLRRAVGGRL